MFKSNKSIVLVLAVGSIIVTSQNLFCQCTDSCPPGSTEAAVTVALLAYPVNPDGSTGPFITGGELIGRCQKIRIRASLSYLSTGPSGFSTAAFSGGRLFIQTVDRVFSQDVTPSGGVSIISAVPPGGCAEGGTNFFLSNFTTDFDISTHEAEISGDGIFFQAAYGPEGTVVYFCPPVTNLLSGTGGLKIQVAPALTCVIGPQTNAVVAGGVAEFAITASGAGPFTYSWIGPNGFTSTNSSIMITNVQLSSAGDYTVVVDDIFGCSTSCSGRLIVAPQFTTLLIDGSDLILSGSGGPSNAAYSVLTTTSLTNPAWLWTPISTNNFDANGRFALTNTLNLTEPQRYFRLLLQ